jgi:UDP-N-acetylmuramoylalanine--D-glutamate ligase
MAAVELLRALNREVTLIDDHPDRGNEDVLQKIDSANPVMLDSSRTPPAGTGGLVLSPGVPYDHPLAESARRDGLHVLGELELGGLAAPAGRTVAVTGTNGKTTVTMMIDAILREAGLPSIAAGNIGLPWCKAILDNPDPDPGIHWVLEVSSFQLETIHRFHPDVSIILNISPDHLDRHGTIEHYTDLKARITENQDGNDVLIVNQDDGRCLKIASQSRARVVKYSMIRPVDEGCFLEGDLVMFQKPGTRPKRLFSINQLNMEGLHNISNAMAAACAAQVLGVSRKKTAAAIRQFMPADHRLQCAGEIDGVRYINDSKATNIEAMLSAVMSFGGQIHLVAGGRDKDSPFTSIAGQLAGQVKKAWLIGEAADAMNAAWSGHVSCQDCKTLESALEQATAAAEPGDVVLLSPGCASFDQFKSYAERGDIFCRWVTSHSEQEDKSERKDP